MRGVGTDLPLLWELIICNSDRTPSSRQPASNYYFIPPMGGGGGGRATPPTPRPGSLHSSPRAEGGPGGGGPDTGGDSYPRAFDEAPYDGPDPHTSESLRRIFEAGTPHPVRSD